LTRAAALDHLARANPHARQLADGVFDALVLFTGPNAYITPSWYASKAEHGCVAPTWNYVAVHVHGRAVLRDEPNQARSRNGICMS